MQSWGEIIEKMHKIQNNLYRHIFRPGSCLTNRNKTELLVTSDPTIISINYKHFRWEHIAPLSIAVIGA